MVGGFLYKSIYPFGRRVLLNSCKDGSRKGIRAAGPHPSRISNERFPRSEPQTLWTARERGRMGDVPGRFFSLPKWVPLYSTEGDPPALKTARSTARRVGSSDLAEAWCAPWGIRCAGSQEPEFQH